MNALEAAVRVAGRKWSQTSTSAWVVAAGVLLVAVGLIAGITDQFESKGAVVLVCIGVFVAAVAVIVRAIRR